METLKERVITIINRHLEDDYTLEEFVADLSTGGCQSGLVGELIYYSQTEKFYLEWQTEINDLLYRMLDETGLSPAELFGDKWDEADPLALHQLNRNLLAWFAFEETAFEHARDEGLEI